MKTNLTTIQEVIDYIDSHLEEKLSLDDIAGEIGYSKYHFCRMFVNIVGFTVHAYVQRRRLTEAARLLVYTDKPLMEIALFAGYETQQSFTIGFKSLFRQSPKAFRKRKNFYPLQLKFNVTEKHTLRGDKVLEIRSIESSKILLTGYKANTRLGFSVIGKYARKIDANKHLVKNRTNSAFLIGLNDYSAWSENEGKQPAFDYYAAVEVESFESVPRNMVTKELAAAKYVVFSFRAKKEDSLQPVADYVYKEWFPQSTCIFNENARYDFSRYGEAADEDGKSLIEYWVPIL